MVKSNRVEDAVWNSNETISNIETLSDELFVEQNWDRGVVSTAARPALRLAPLPQPAEEHQTLSVPFVPTAGNQSFAYQAVKRAMDILGSLVAIVLLSPFMLAALVVLTITTKGRPLFRQERIGQNGRKIWLFKFRTMHVNADQMQHLVKNEKDGPIFKNRRDPRITRIGAFLRRTSIDEMPQLFNVLVGNMSLVGPRPPVAKEVVKYQPWQLQRLAIKPGLTCLWQVSGRSEVGFEDWMKMDVWYVENQSLLEDVKLLVRTPLCVLSGRGAY